MPRRLRRRASPAPPAARPSSRSIGSVPACGTANPDYRPPQRPADSTWTPVPALRSESSDRRCRCPACRAFAAHQALPVQDLRGGGRDRSEPAVVCLPVLRLDLRRREFTPDQSGRQRPEFVIGFAITPEQAQEKFTQVAAREQLVPAGRPGRGVDRRQAEGHLPAVLVVLDAGPEPVAGPDRRVLVSHRDLHHDATPRATCSTTPARCSETEWWPLRRPASPLLQRLPRLRQPRLAPGPVAPHPAVQPAGPEALRAVLPRRLAGRGVFGRAATRRWRSASRSSSGRSSGNIAAFLPGDTHSGLAVETAVQPRSTPTCACCRSTSSATATRTRSIASCSTARPARWPATSRSRGTRIAIAVGVVLAIIARDRADRASSSQLAIMVANRNLESDILTSELHCRVRPPHQMLRLPGLARRGGLVLRELRHRSARPATASSRRRRTQRRHAQLRVPGLRREHELRRLGADAPLPVLRLREAGGAEGRRRSCGRSWVVPFAIEQNDALARLRQWLGSSFWRPGDLAQTAEVTTLTQVYVPYWVFAARVFTYWTADTSQTPLGRPRRLVSRWPARTSANYSGVLVGASSVLTPAETNAICPFDLSAGVPPEQVDLENVVYEQFRVQRKYARPLAQAGLEEHGAAGLPASTSPATAAICKVNVRVEGPDRRAGAAAGVDHGLPLQGPGPPLSGQRPNRPMHRHRPDVVRKIAAVVGIVIAVIVAILCLHGRSSAAIARADRPLQDSTPLRVASIIATPISRPTAE